MSSDGNPFHVGIGSQTRLEIRLLGTVTVTLNGRGLRAFDSTRLQRFLALIVLSEGPLQRIRLAYELWPDSDESQARTNLRKLLHEFRHALPDIGEYVEIDNHVIAWRGVATASVDVLQFREAMQLGDLKLAGRLYRGDLLPACYDDWTLEERARLRTEAHGVVRHLAESAAEHGDHAEAVEHAGRAVEILPTDDGAVLLQMEAHLALGDRASALRAYHRCVETFQNDLGTTPAPDLHEAYRRILGSTPGGRRDGAETTGPISDAPLVGRAAEWATLLNVWAMAQKGAAHFVLVTGEPGIGKSRLAAELARHASADGHAVASARAYEAAGRLPWGPVVDLLRSDVIRRQIQTLDLPWRHELVRLLPELTEAEDYKRSAPVGGDAARYRLFDAVAKAFVATERPLMLIIDDLQWCDAESIELIGFLIQSGRSAPVLIVGTVRSEEVGDSHPLGVLVDALIHDRAVTTVPLDRLDAPTTATLASELSDHADLGPNAEQLWTETEGNPLFVVEAVRAGLSEGSLRTLSPTIRAVLHARLDQLSTSARKVVDVAAVIGRSFSIELIAAVIEASEVDLVDDIDELWRRRIIRDNGLTYDFSHDKLRTVALEMVSPARRRLIHRAVAEALEADLLLDSSAAVPRLAAHYDQAGMIEPAIDAYRRAGRGAAALSALGEATTMFNRALVLVADVPPSSARDEVELEVLIALGALLAALDGYGSADTRQVYERASSLCRRLGRPVDPPILRGLGLAAIMACRFDVTAEFGHALADHADGRSVTRTEGLYLLGVSSFWRGDLAGARHHLEGVLDSYGPADRDEHLAAYVQDPKAVALIRLALTELWAGEAVHAEELARAALQHARDLDHLVTLGYVTSYAAMIAGQTDDLDRCRELVEQMEGIWTRESVAYWKAVGEVMGGWLDVHEGAAAGITRILTVIERWRANNQTLHLTHALLLLAGAWDLLGEVDAARAAANEALVWSEAHDQHYLVAELFRIDGELAYRQGDSVSARNRLENAALIASAQGAAWLELRALNALASRFPDPPNLQSLADILGTLPSCRHLQTFRAAEELLRTNL